MGLHLGQFFKLNTCTLFNLQLGVCRCGATAKLYVLIYTTLYRELDYLWILVSARGPGTNSPQIPKGNLSFGGGKSYIRIFDCVEVGSLNPALWKGQL